MCAQRRARDLHLLDAIDKLERTSISDTVWRTVRSGRNPVLGYASGGRWDTGQIDVLYTSFDPNGAIAEMYFHLSRQPIFPSKVDFTLNEIDIETKNSLKFANIEELMPYGVDINKYSKVMYDKTQEIADAAYFLGFDGIISPNARWDCLNLALFTDIVGPNSVHLKNSSIIDWEEFLKKNNQRNK